MVNIRSHHIPMVIYQEHRADWRISLGKKAIHLRIPIYRWKGFSGEDPLRWANRWVNEKFEEDPALFYHYILPTPHHGKIYQTLYGDFRLSLQAADREQATGKMQLDTIQILYPRKWTEVEKREAFPKLISRVFASSFRSQFLINLIRLNRQHFGYRYKNIFFKYNSSNWGSCSTKGNLNFSTRLFLAPQEVVDYVIIHELAHLKVQNHSQKFWRLVASALPEYKNHVNWLGEHGKHLYF